MTEIMGGISGWFGVGIFFAMEGVSYPPLKFFILLDTPEACNKLVTSAPLSL